MAIIYPLSTPTTIGIEQINLSAVNATSITSSPFTFRQQVVQHTGQRWEAQVKIPALRKDLMEPWVAFLVSLKGQYGYFLLGDPNNTTPQGFASTSPGTPVVKDADQTGDTLEISGLPINTTNYLKAGDYLQLNAGASATLHKVLTDTSSDGSGYASVDIWPNMITAPGVGTTIVLTNSKGRFRLKNNVTEWSINNANAYGLQFEAIGVVP
jgi:hypothetical protein